MNHRAHQLPFDTKLRKKKKFKKAFELEDSILGREKLADYMSRAEGNSEVGKKLDLISEVQKDELCRGKQLRVRCNGCIMGDLSPSDLVTVAILTTQHFQNIYFIFHSDISLPHANIRPSRNVGLVIMATSNFPAVSMENREITQIP